MVDALKEFLIQFINSTFLLYNNKKSLVYDVIKDLWLFVHIFDDKLLIKMSN